MPKMLTATKVLSAARKLAGYKPAPGANKVWIADLYQVAAPYNYTLDAFKAWLLDQHKAGALELSRYDLADEPELSQASEISYLNATFHRVVAR